jgi:hypothetical protein
MAAGPRMVSARTAQKTSLPLSGVLSLPGKHAPEPFHSNGCCTVTCLHSTYHKRQTVSCVAERLLACQYGSTPWCLCFRNTVFVRLLFFRDRFYCLRHLLPVIVGEVWSRPVLWALAYVTTQEN